MRIRLTEDWVHLVVPECPKRFGAILLSEGDCTAFEDRAIGEVVSAGPDALAKEPGLAAGVKVAYNENKYVEMPAYTRENQVFVRWRDCIGIVESDPVPTAEKWKKAEEYVEERKKAAAAGRAAQRLVTASPAAAAALAGAAGEAKKPELVTP